VILPDPLERADPPITPTRNRLPDISRIAEKAYRPRLCHSRHRKGAFRAFFGRITRTVSDFRIHDNKVVLKGCRKCHHRRALPPLFPISGDRNRKIRHLFLGSLLVTNW
jgi:hypothetical protein